MNKFILSLGASLLLLSANGFAQTYTSPADNPVLSIEFPDTWETSVEDDGSLTGKTDDGEVEINLWALDSEAVESDAEAALGKAAEEVGEIIGEWVSDFTSSKATKADINGIPSIEVMGIGKAKDGGEEVLVSADFFSPDGKSIFVLMFWGTEVGLTKHMEDLGKVGESIKKP